MENLLLYNQYYQRVRRKFEQDLLYTTVHVIYEYNNIVGKPLTNKKLHSLLFLVNARRYEKNLGFYRNDEIPEFEKWTIGYDAWDKGPIQTFIQNVTKRYQQNDLIGQAEFRLLQLLLKPEYKVKDIRPVITEIVDAYGPKNDQQLAKMIAEFLIKENSLGAMRSFRKSKLKFEV